MNKQIDPNEIAGNGYDDADSGIELNIDMMSESSKQAAIEDRDRWLQSRVALHAERVPF